MCRQFMIPVLLEVCIKIHYIVLSLTSTVVGEGHCSVRSCADGYSSPRGTQRWCRNSSGMKTRSIGSIWLRVCYSTQVISIDEGWENLLWLWFPIIRAKYFYVYFKSLSLDHTEVLMLLHFHVSGDFSWRWSTRADDCYFLWWRLCQRFCWQSFMWSSLQGKWQGTTSL